MKLPSLADLFLISIQLLVCSADDRNYKTDFEIYRAHEGLELDPISADLPVNLSDASYFITGLLSTPQKPSSKDARLKRDHADDDYNFSKGYEEFLAENFGFIDTKSERNDDSTSSSNESDTNHDQITCQIVYRDKKECKICKNPKTNAEAENCSYSSSSKPKKYAYKRQRKYGRSHSSEENDSRSGSEEEETYATPARLNVNSTKLMGRPVDHTTAPVKENSPKRPRDEVNFPHFAVEKLGKKDRSKCYRKYKNGIICFYCNGKSGVRSKECLTSYDGPAKAEQDTTELTRPERSALDAQLPSFEDDVTAMEKQVFKRTVSVHIRERDFDLPENQKTFLYAQNVVHVTK